MASPYIVLPGKVSGVLGTDSQKRDIWTGVLAGVKWALLIGILTAIVSVSIGVIYGVISAYLGGWKDALMQRVFEVFVSVPLLPVLIVLSAVFEPSIWMMVVLMAMFFWTGSVKTVRSMAMQIKEETFIEASRALGASNFRIIFKHMVPILIPYSFSSMALFIPRAVVYEASISLLGLGDSQIVTWGQILSDALNSGAVLNGLWWWVVPPGLAIAFMGMAFAFIGFSMDKILHPKLRTR
jgi:peptide/nickel transport system permease protein